MSADGALEWERHLALGWGTSQLSALARYEVFIAQVFRPYLPRVSHRWSLGQPNRRWLHEALAMFSGWPGRAAELASERRRRPVRAEPWDGTAGCRG